MLLSAIPFAGDTSEKPWYFGAHLSYLATTDYIHSNAAIMYTHQFGEDGIPFTGDPGERNRCEPNPGRWYPEQDPFCDPRRDDLVAREGTIEDSFMFGVTIGYRLAAHFEVQLDAGYLRGGVGPIDVYRSETTPRYDRQGLPILLSDYSTTTPIPAGELTQYPISLSGIVPFRTGKRFRPYLGAGIGVILTDLDANEGDEITGMLAAIQQSRVRGWGNEFGQELTDPAYNGLIQKEDGQIPFTLPLDVKIGDAHEWHLLTGLEYSLNARMSLIFDARYIFVDREVEIDLGGQDQLDILYWPEQLYRPDGTLKVYIGAAAAPNPVCTKEPGAKYGCYNQPANARVNPEGLRFNPFNPSEPLPGVTCPAIADFNRDGRLDVCYDADLRSLAGNPVTGMWVVQGGSINLSAYSLAIGMTFHL